MQEEIILITITIFFSIFFIFKLLKNESKMVSEKILEETRLEKLLDDNKKNINNSSNYKNKDYLFFSKDS